MKNSQIFAEKWAYKVGYKTLVLSNGTYPEALTATHSESYHNR